ncbi:uncharacterized protein LOC132268926 [Cornus florida]|uniref:uncharacterized protein LOC132268926 n=1 Tax=Cornus florida TaxID=4283 RepID=UPI00289DAE2C|nr:uncharacterized protein LOC132268926 [Cornus florida]
MGKKTAKYSVVDAFTDSPFKGNPAAVCLLEEERDEEWLQSVASEFNASTTCYLTRLTHSESNIQESSDVIINSNKFRLRWFTPVAEVKLCGHVTLAASHYLFTSGLVNGNEIEYLTLSGILTAKRVPAAQRLDSLMFQNGEAHECSFIELNFPIVPIIEFTCAEVLSLSKALGGVPVMEIKKTTGDDLFVVLSSGKAVADLQPHFDEIQKCPGRGIIVTGLAPSGSGFDFISRFFCPKLGVNEDPVCGSAHCALAPYWSKKLGKCDFVAYQASSRGGIVNVHLDEKNERVLLRGNAITVMEGSLLC